MRLLKLALIAFCVTLCFSSCKRDYVCRCTGGIAKSGFDVHFQNMNYGRAKNDCQEYTSPVKGPDAVTCELLVD